MKAQRDQLLTNSLERIINTTISLLSRLDNTNFDPSSLEPNLTWDDIEAHLEDWQVVKAEAVAAWYAAQQTRRTK